MKNKEHIHGEYTPEESLELDNMALHNAKYKLQRKLNIISKEFYAKEVISLIEDIKNRTIFIKKLKKTGQSTIEQ